jgi:methionyl-tRNA synthetase
MRNKILVTSALPYANGKIHIGHIAGAYLPADIFVRFSKLKNRDVVFISGTDEHGVPITITAEKEKTTPKNIVDKYHKIIKDNFNELGISFDNFSRTSKKIHFETSQDFFTTIKNNGYLEEKNMSQYYCDKCKRFLADRYIEGKCSYCGAEGARGDQCESCGKWLNPELLLEAKCKICGDTPLMKETKHFFLNMSKFQDKIKNWLSEKNDWKDNVINYCEGWLKEGLTERPITRDLTWGIPVPVEGYENKVIYVWFEAPIGYISSTKEWAVNQGQPDLWKDYWQNPDCEIIHFIGKDNIVFHSIVFPITLMAYEGDYSLVSQIPANEFLNISSKKVSTSRNWAIWVEDYLKYFPPDILRWTLAITAPETRDADFTWDDFQMRNNTDLVGVIGNFVNRTLTFISKYFDSKIPSEFDLSENDLVMLKSIENTRDSMANSFDAFKVKEAANTFLKFAKSANKYFNDSEPWKTNKSAPKECAATLYVCSQLVLDLAKLMYPIIPFTTSKIFALLNIHFDEQKMNWDNIGIDKIDKGHTISKPKIIFKKIEDKEIEFQNNLLLKQEKNEVEIDTGIITIDDFFKAKLKTAKIIEAENVKKSKKLVRLIIKIGEEKRQIVAGIAEYYSPEELLGKTIIVVSNLKKAKLFGLESNGMLLAAKKDGKLKLLSVDGDIEDGAEVS